MAATTEQILAPKRFELDRAKLKALVHYVCYKADAMELLGATKLNKILFYSDFLFFKIEGRPITGETYVKQQHGAVPRHVLSVLEELRAEGTLLIRDVPYFGYSRRDFVCLGAPDLSLFSPQEIALIDTVIEVVVFGHTARSISELSHDDAWEVASIGEQIPYEAAFASSTGELDASDLEWPDTSRDRN
jgi:hypothetical protein